MYHETPDKTARPVKIKEIAVNFNGGKLTSDAGAVLFRQLDQKLQLTERINTLIHDPRDPFFTVHQQRDLIAQRIFSIAPGYEDVNDHQPLRHDPALLAAVKNTTDENQPPGSAPTLSRFENRIKEQQLMMFADRTSCHKVFAKK